MAVASVRAKLSRGPPVGIICVPLLGLDCPTSSLSGHFSEKVTSPGDFSAGI